MCVCLCVYPSARWNRVGESFGYIICLNDAYICNAPERKPFINEDTHLYNDIGITKRHVTYIV